MLLKKIGLYSVSIAVLAIGLIGCGGEGGGGGAGTTDINAVLDDFVGDAETGAVGDGFATVRVRQEDGSAVDAIVPVGLTVAPGDAVAGINGGNINASYVAETAIDVNGSPTNLKVGIDGRLSGALALPEEGEVSLNGEGTTRELTTRRIAFRYKTYRIGRRAYKSKPLELKARNLDNGKRTTNGTVEAWFRASTPDSFRASLFVDYGNGIVINRGPSMLEIDPATGRKYVKWNANGGTTIPSSGVQLIRVSCR
ncbi:MAG: hypothetical protein KIS66_04120 [Fimbriimonadaceae bacterium]|nr:hypothetical protein [Fimbriimonadaceae bacterium]